MLSSMGIGESLAMLDPLTGPGLQLRHTSQIHGLGFF